MIDLSPLPDDCEIDFGIKRSRFPKSVSEFRVFIIKAGPVMESWEGVGATREEAFKNALQSWGESRGRTTKHYEKGDGRL